MTLLFVLTAALLLTSGLVKLRALQRVGLGIAILPVLEVLMAVALLAVAWTPLTGGQGFMVAAGSLTLLLVSSLRVGFTLRAYRRERERTLGSRLAVYVKYLSKSPPEA